MLDPRPGRTTKFPTPTRILSTKQLRASWQRSRDSSPRAGRPGTDEVTAQQFSADLTQKLAQLSKDLRFGTYGPTSLKAVFIPKPNSTKERMICIPSVKDRIVQRTISRYLTLNKKFPIYNSSSYGFIEERGTQAAIKEACRLRSEYDWCLKTDIEAFFDRIPREHLKDRVQTALGNHSLVPLIFKFIDCEIKQTAYVRPKLERQGIKFGVGVRQGMPLSPILANLILSRFDAKVEKRQIPMIRYADDILLFFKSKRETEEGHKWIGSMLKKIGLSIPELADRSKTVIKGRKEPIDFLGREIVWVSLANAYVSRISKSQIEKIKAQLEEDYSYSSRIKQGTLHDTIIELWRSIAAYIGTYKDAYNFPTLDSELRFVEKKIVSEIFVQIFGEAALSKTSIEERKFLGIGHLKFLDDVENLEMLD